MGKEGQPVASKNKSVPFFVLGAGAAGKAGAKVTEAVSEAVGKKLDDILKEANDRALQAKNGEKLPDGKLNPEPVIGPCCFAAGTLVATPSGERAIDSLKVGDIVWSKPEKGGEPFAAAILATHVRTDQPIYRLKLESIRSDGKAESETLLVTPGHPFYVPARHGFIPVIDLKSGDLLQSLGDGATENVSSQVRSLELFQPQGKTYNLTVDIGHTFYVGKLKTWVHNVGPCSIDGKPINSTVEGAKGSVEAPKGGFGPVYRPADSDQLERILTSYYGADKTGSRVGNGGLADAVRYEKTTGDMLSPAGHEQKAIEVGNRLSDFVRNADNQPPGKYPYSQRDIDFAKQLIKDIDNALGR